VKRGISEGDGTSTIGWSSTEVQSAETFKDARGAQLGRWSWDVFLVPAN